MSGFLASIAGATYAPPVAQTAVAFDGTNDFYIASSITPSSTTGKFLTVACTFYWDSSGGNLQHLVNMRYGTVDDASGLGWRMWINGGRIQNTFMGGNGSYYSSVYENAENSLTSGAFNQIVFYSDFNNSANNRIFVNGVSKAITSDGWSSAHGVGWGKTNSKIKIGEREDVLGGDGSDNDFKGRVSQLYIHNAAGTPGIWKFWNTTTNLPIDLGTNGTATGLPQPLIYHYGTTSTFPTNNGTGFASYTLTATGDVTGAAGPTYGTRLAQTNPTSFVKLGTPSAVAGYGDSGITDGVTSSATAFTFSAWAYPTLTGHTGSEWCLLNLPNTDGGNASMYISIKDNGSLRFYRQVPGIEGADYSDLVSGAFPTANTWYHILITGQVSSTFVVYINGVKQTSLQYGGGLSGNNFQTQILTAVRIGIADAVNYAGGKGDQFTQVYFDTVNADIDANLTKFYNNGYVEMGSQGTSSGLSRPLIYHYGNTSTFATSGGRTSASSGNYLTYNLLDNDVGTITNG